MRQIIKSTTLFVFLFYLMVQSSFAESLRFNRLNSSNGLPQDSIRSIAQDHNGFMWFATEDGIARYDGHHLKVYRYDPDDPYSIQQNVAYQFLVDDKNRLWISTQGEGVMVLDQKSGQFHPVTNKLDSIKKEKVGEFASALYQRSSNEMFIGSNNGVFRVSTKDLKVTAQLVQQEELGNNQVINALWEDENKSLWMTSEDGKIAYLPSNGKLIIIKNNIDTIYNRKFLKGIGNVLVAGKNGLFIIDSSNKALIPFLQDVLPKEIKITDIEQSANGVLWIATRSGLIRHNTDTNKTILISKNLEDEHSLSSNRITSLFLSEESILWVGTSDNGINSTNLNDYGFTTLTSYDPKLITSPSPSTDHSEGLSSNVIWSIFRDSSGTLWVGSNGGLSSQKEGQQNFNNYTSLGTGDHKVNFDSIWSIAEANGYLWFGTWDDGLIRYSPETGETFVYSTQSAHGTQLSGNIIRLLLYDKKRNSLWVGTQFQGLNQIDFNTGMIHHYRHNPSDKSSIPDQWIRSLYLDHENRLWVGTGGSVIALFNDQDKTFQAPELTDDLVATDVRGIYQYDGNTLFLSSGYGLHRFDIDQFKVVKTFHEKDGLPRSTLYNLIADNENSFWITSTYGLTHFDPENEAFTNFYTTHNLQANEFNLNASWQDPKGTIFIGGPGGITHFHPNNVNDEYVIHRPVITEIKSYDSELQEQIILHTSDQSTLQNHSLILEADRRKLSIDFTTPEYIFQDRVKYRYRLLGNEETWISATNRDVPIQYTNLNPGEYEFQLQTIGKDSRNIPTLSIALQLKAHFWELWWFKVLMIILSFTLFFFIVKKWMKHNFHKRIAQERSAHYQMVVHDLGPSLNRSEENITLITEHYTNNGKQTPESLKNLQIDTHYAFSFIKQLRSISQVEGYSLQEKELYLLEDLIYDSLATFKVDRNRIKLTHIPDASVLIYQNSLTFIVRNLISNAIKYSGSESPIEIDLQTLDNDLIIKVIDQGVGIPTDIQETIFQPYTRGHNIYKIEGLGIGLSLTKKIINKYNGNIKIHSNNPKGSIITVLLRNVITDDPIENE